MAFSFCEVETHAQLVFLWLPFFAVGAGGSLLPSHVPRQRKVTFGCGSPARSFLLTVSSDVHEPSLSRALGTATTSVRRKLRIVHDGPLRRVSSILARPLSSFGRVPTVVVPRSTQHLRTFRRLARSFPLVHVLLWFFRGSLAFFPRGFVHVLPCSTHLFRLVRLVPRPLSFLQQPSTLRRLFVRTWRASDLPTVAVRATCAPKRGSEGPGRPLRPPGTSRCVPKLPCAT